MFLPDTKVCFLTGMLYLQSTSELLQLFHEPERFIPAKDKDRIGYMINRCLCFFQAQLSPEGIPDCFDHLNLTAIGIVHDPDCLQVCRDFSCRNKLWIFLAAVRAASVEIQGGKVLPAGGVCTSLIHTIHLLP